MEASDILHFLDFICHEELDVGDYLYLRYKVGRAISAHDDKSEYFIPLRELATELDCMTRCFLQRMDWD